MLTISSNDNPVSNGNSCHEKNHRFMHDANISSPALMAAVVSLSLALKSKHTTETHAIESKSMQ